MLLQQCEFFLLLHSNFEFIFIVQSKQPTLSARRKRTKKETSVAGNLFSVCIVNFTQDEMVEMCMGLAHYGFHLKKKKRKKYSRLRKISPSK
jgi:hypothetical protein